MSIYKQVECDCCGDHDRPIRIETEPSYTPLPDGWAAHVVDGVTVHLCESCNQKFNTWMSDFFECDQI